MKKAVHILGMILLGLLVSFQVLAQCIPDTVTCVDTTGNPGEFCPLDLPDAGLNAVYDQTITVIPPGSFLFSGVELNIFFIEIDSVLNLPPGIDYSPNADVLYPDTAYCIQLSGTPTQTGDFDLAIYITATVDFGGPLRYQVVDDTSISISVVEELGLKPDQGRSFMVNQNIPNPFSETTRLRYYTHRAERVELSVYNILGSLQYHEIQLAEPGTHSFLFNGSELEPGTYLYRVKVRDHFHTGKFMKSR